mmetsp:Transcript_8995/g.26134  ORF Transcript_8995/g.26134 Transcript_8995/m.26134 type:complete len:137 (+) Transcript_8995:68-478(+)
MPVKKKAGAKKGAKKKASKEDDTPKPPPTQYISIEVVNAKWQSMRFTMHMTTDQKISTVVSSLQAKHDVGVKGLRLYVGDQAFEESMIDVGSDPTLSELGIQGGHKIFDKFTQVITYDYPPFHSVLNLPVETSFIM